MAKKLPEVVVRKLWKLKQPDRRKAYSTRRDSPTEIQVLEEGSKILHRAKVTADDRAQYAIERGWLVERTYPAAKQRAEEASAAARVRRAAVRKVNSDATRNPAFQTFLKQLTKATGTPTKVRTCGVSMWSFPRLKTDSEFFEWQARAREAGGALTNHKDYRGSTLRLVSGSVSRLGALFGESYWYGDGVENVLDALDRDAGLVIDFIEYEGMCFELALDRAPKRPAQHAKALGKVFRVESATIKEALGKRLWTYYNEFY